MIHHIPSLNPHLPIDRTQHRLPHWSQGQAAIFISWRTADALPRAWLDQYTGEKADWEARHPRPWTPAVAAEYRRHFSARMEHWIDRGHGACVLRTPGLRRLMEKVLHYGNGTDYALLAFVIMPNHVHVLCTLTGKETLPRTVATWKALSARRINQRLGVTGAFWQESYWDRLVRGQPHFLRCLRYIRNNPLKAGLGEKEYSLYIRPCLLERLNEIGARANGP